MNETPAETLLQLATTLMADKGVLIECDEKWRDYEPLVARIKFALDFKSRGTGFVFRAIAEEWTLDRIRQEVY